MSWIIEDWAGNHVYKDKQFNSYQETRDFIDAEADRIAYEKYPEDETKRNELAEGISEDLYATQI